MEERSVTHSTFVLERTYTAPPERVFAAFAEPAKKRRWFVEGPHHQVEHYQIEFRAEGKEQARFRFNEGTALAGVVCTNDTLYQDVVPDQRIVFASSMTLGDRCISASLVTAEFLPAKSGTELILTHQGAFFEGADGPEMREQGWRKLLENLQQEFSR